MESYTFNSREMIRALGESIHDGGKYPMTLSPGDMKALVAALSVSMGTGIEWGDFSPEVRERAVGLLNSIAYTYGIEGV